MHRFISAISLMFLTIAVFSYTLNAQVTPGAGGNAKVHGQQQIYAGYSYLTADFRGNDFSSGGMNGWDVSYAAPLTSHFDLKVSSFGYRKDVDSATQAPIFFAAGAQYGKKIGKESLFVEGLAGMVHINSDWFYGNNYPSGSSTNSLAEVAGGGIDTPITKHLSWRVEGDMVHTNIGVGDNQIHGLPNFFGKVSTGVVFNF